MSKKSALTGLFVLALIIGLVFCATPGQASLVNGGFETGDLSGWTKNADGGLEVITWPGEGPWHGLNAPDGASFLRINATPFGERSVYQTFTLGGSGGALSGWYAAANNAMSYVRIFKDNTLVEQFSLFRLNGVSGWQTWNWATEAGGNYTLVFAATGEGAGGFDVKTVGAPAVPVPTTAYLLGAGLIGLYGIRRRFSRKQKS